MSGAASSAGAARADQPSRDTSDSHEPTIVAPAPVPAAADTANDEAEPGAPVHAALALDRVVHEPARLAILAVLSGVAEVDFAFLQAATGLTKGNLSRQASKLEEVGYVTIRKYFRGKIPATGYRITTAGRAALTRYGEQIAAIGQRIQLPAE